MGKRKTWADKREEIMSRPGAGAAYEAARIRFDLGVEPALSARDVLHDHDICPGKRRPGPTPVE
ncbi:hypothetical protein ACLQ2R_00225 [Streptosporangium sp. DT93]|uniref:hypothetical protein n=1 Tax=Streptosporangium sp. DT93 TaxID=3393428 RepID=UPI003CE69229